MNLKSLMVLPPKSPEAWSDAHPFCKKKRLFAYKGFVKLKKPKYLNSGLKYSIAMIETGVESKDNVPQYSSSLPLSRGYIFVPGKENEGTFGFGNSPVLYYGRRTVYHSGDRLQAPYFVRLSDLEKVLSSWSNLRFQKAGQETLVRRTLTGGLVVQRKNDSDPYTGRAVFSRHETGMIKNMVQLYAKN